MRCRRKKSVENSIENPIACPWVRNIAGVPYLKGTVLLFNVSSTDLKPPMGFVIQENEVELYF